MRQHCSCGGISVNISQEMCESTNQAERWDEGCQNDDARNRFIIPEVGRILTERGSTTIVDIGAGTGYVARMLHEHVPTAKWTLVDRDESRLNLASARCPPAMEHVCVPLDVVKLTELGQTFDAAIVIFTLLELDDPEELVRALAAAVPANGAVIVAQPDLWVDVLFDPASSQEKVQEFLVGSTFLDKIDKFTGDKYPFRARRIELIIDMFLRNGFILRYISPRSDTVPSVIVLEFGRVL